MWIPIVFIAVLIWAIVGAHNGIQTAGFHAQANRDKTKREDFDALVKPSDKLWTEVTNTLSKDENVRGRIVSDFMADGDLNWAVFARGSFDPARMVLLSQHGKLDSRAVYGLCTPSPPNCPEPWKMYAMMEKFMLRIEETLQESGVNAILVANYSPTDVYNGGYTYYPVRDYVKRYGYAREGYINFGTRFSWSEAVGHNYQPDLDR